MTLLLLIACGDEELPAELGDCEDGTSLTWSDVEPVFDEHCTACHDSALGEGERAGAPLLIDFDGPESAATNGFQTWSMVWAGRMPPAGPVPEDQAWLLWEWLSCGGPP